MKKIFLLLILAWSLSYGDIYTTFNVIANKKADLAFTAGGTIKKMYVEVGSEIKKNDILAQLDNRQSKLMLELAKNDLNKAKISAIQRNNSLKRYKKVKEVLEDERYEKVFFAAKYADIAVLKASNNVRLYQIQLDNTYLKAPFDGIITAKYKEVGDTLSKAQPKKIYNIISKNSVKLLIEFDERHHNRVKVGQSFVYTIDGLKTKRVGKITKIYPTIDTKTRKMRAEVKANGLIPGIFGDGYIKE